MSHSFSVHSTVKLRIPLFMTAAFVAQIVAAGEISIPSRGDSAAKAITPQSIEAPIRILSSDLFEGRGPASRGDELTQLYLATELQGLGLEPGGPDGSWMQPFDIVGITADAPKTIEVRSPKGSESLAWWDDYIAASGVQSDQATIDNAELVFVGYGIEAPEYQWNDFKGMNLKGKVLVMLNNDPDWDPKLFAGNRRLYYGRWTYKYESAARQGAAGAIIIHTVPSAGYKWQVVQTSWSGEQFELPATGEPAMQVKGWLTEDAAKKLFGLAGKDFGKLMTAARDRKFKPVPLGITTSIKLTNKITRVKTANVAGLLRGSDPKLKDEVVVYTAHHDHLGIGTPDKTGDKIYNGARDNALGVGLLLSIARAWTALPEPPRRSVLFLFVAAEEQGLLGSEYYVEHPTFPLGRMTAIINFDGGSSWGRTSDQPLVGFGKSNIDSVVAAVVGRDKRVITDEQFPDRGSFYRSDQFNFAKKGVPAVYFGKGTKFVDRPAEEGKAEMEAWLATNYHQPNDQMDSSWRFDGLVEEARTGFLVGLTISESDEGPVWNKGDEFEAARLDALRKVAKGE